MEEIKCRKTKFATEEVANKFIDKLNNSSKRSEIPVKSYLCSKCLVWHVTKSLDKEKIKLQKEIVLLIKEKKELSDELRNTNKKYNLDKTNCHINILKNQVRSLIKLNEEQQKKIDSLQSIVNAYIGYENKVDGVDLNLIKMTKQERLAMIKEAKKKSKMEVD